MKSYYGYWSWVLVVVLFWAVAGPADAGTVQLPPAQIGKVTSWRTLDTAGEDDTVFNGDGLTGDQHDDDVQNMWFSYGFTDEQKWLKVDLGGTYYVDHLNVWNYNKSGYLNRGIQSFDLFIALEDPESNVDQSEVAFHPYGWTLAVTNEFLNISPGGSSIGPTDLNVGAGGVQAAYLLFFIHNNFGAALPGHAGLSEVQIFIDDTTSATYALTVMNGSGSGVYTEGTAVNILADPAPAGMEFHKWFSPAPVSAFGDRFSPSTTFTVPPGVYEVRAVYVPANAGVVKVSNAGMTATSSGNGAGVPIDAVNGSGMTGDLHDNDIANMWLSGGAVMEGKWIKIALGDTVYLDHLKIWNYNETGALDKGVRQVDVYVAETDPGSNANLSGELFHPDGWFRVLHNYPLAQSPGGAAIAATDAYVPMHGMKAAYVAVRLDGGYGGPFTRAGFSEIEFYALEGGAGTNETGTLTVNNGTGDGVYPPGTVVPIAANPAPGGMLFDAWTGDTDTVANVAASSTTVTMPASSSMVVDQTFEAGTVGESVLTDGPWDLDDWAFWDPSQWTIEMAAGTGNNGSKVGQPWDNPNNGLMRRPFSNPGLVPDATVEPVVVLGAKLMAIEGGSRIMIEFAKRTIHGPQFGIYSTPNTSDPVYFMIRQYNHPTYGTRFFSTEALTYNQWYDVELRITTSPSNWSLATGSLFYRASGTSEWLPATGLQDVVMGYDANNSNPDNATHWRVFGAYGAQIDDLAFGTPGSVPNVTVTATYESVGGATFSIHSQILGPGSLSPVSPLNVASGGTAQVVYTAADGFEISSFNSNGVLVPAAHGAAAYTSVHANVQADITNKVRFAWTGAAAAVETLLDPAAFVVTSVDHKTSISALDDDAFNGTGLLTADTHNNGNGDNWLSLTYGNLPKWIKVNLGGTHTLSHLRVWNYNHSGFTYRGVKQADIYVALSDPGNNTDQSHAAFNAGGWTRVVDNYQFAEGSGAGGAINTDARIDLGGVEAAFLVIAADSNHSGGADASFGLSEVQVYVDSGLADEDADTLPTDWENAYGLDPNDDGSVDPDQGADGDPDLDGATNYEELIADTDPGDANSVFAVTEAVSNPDGSVDVTCSSSALRDYLLQGTNDMSVALPWPVLAGPSAGTGGAMTFNEAGMAGRVYTVEVRMP